MLCNIKECNNIFWFHTYLEIGIVNKLEFCNTYEVNSLKFHVIVPYYELRNPGIIHLKYILM